MKSTSGSQRPGAEVDRDRAWVHLLESNARRFPRHGHGHSSRSLAEISRAYDRIVRHAEGVLDASISEDDLLATLKVIRMLRDKLENDERILMTMARIHKITWQRISEALEMSGRQSAERRHLQLNRGVTKPDGSPPRTQNERVELTREKRIRRGEQDWALRHRSSICQLGRELASLDDLEQRISRSQSTKTINAMRHAETGIAALPDSPAPSHPLQATWPTALRTCVADYERFHADPGLESAPDPEWEKEREDARHLHRMLGLITHAAEARNIDLSDRPDLARKITRLQSLYQADTARR